MLLKSRIVNDKQGISPKLQWYGQHFEELDSCRTRSCQSAS